MLFKLGYGYSVLPKSVFGEVTEYIGDKVEVTPKKDGEGEFITYRSF